MGFAIAESAIKLGADVTLICGPVNLECSKEIQRIDVSSAKEMFDSTISNYIKSDIAILSAAVADFTPEIQHSGKLKKHELGDNPVITLKKTDDILQTLGEMKSSSQILVGFALESDNLIENAKEKMIRKNCDMIIANHANKPQSGFGGDNNTISIINKFGKQTDYLPMPKTQCADIIIKSIIKDF